MKVKQDCYLRKLIRIGLLFLLVVFTENSYAQVVLQQPVRFLALGDSYTIGQSVLTEARWPNQFYSRLQTLGFSVEELTIIARTGWRSDQLMDAIENASLDSKYTLVSLLIGVNNFFQGGSLEQYTTEFEQLLLTAIELTGNNKENVFVVSIPDYAYTPFGNGNVDISAGIDAFNKANKDITAQYDLPYINITPISRKGLEKPELVASDGLHPSGLQYKAWVDLMLEKLQLKTTDLVETEEARFTLVVDKNGNLNLVNSGSSSQGIKSIKVYSISGTLLLESYSLPLSVSQLPSGIYYYHCIFQNQIIYRGAFTL